MLGGTLSNRGCPLLVGVALIWHAVLPSAVVRRGSRGVARLEVALPVLADSGLSEEAELMSRVIVGVDPHKKSVTIEAVDQQGKKVATGRFGTHSTGYRLMLRYVRDQ